MKRTIVICGSFILLFSLACQRNGGKEYIEENQLGIIDASVKSENTNLKEKAQYENTKPGEAVTLDRAFENAPPMIPHTTNGFFPIRKDNNICFSCHLPEKIKESGAVAIPRTHFTSLRPAMVEKDGVLQFEEEQKVHIEERDSVYHAYFNCSQCHAPQASVTVNIENLFSPEFREEFGLEKSDLNEKLEEGIAP